ncbi:hypothetical protein ACHAXS_012017 [Conticribra weissflogii]
MSSKEKTPPNKADAPPRPEIPPGHGGPVRNPNSNDVLSGRGGRINSHSGNVRFREMVESLKREYLDPRTKKLEKARIAARLVATIRHSEPPGRFLKEDPHTGLWIEIGDERAWKKAGQALRESAPEIRAEQQAQLQAAVAAAGVLQGAGSGGKTSVSPVDDFCEEVGSGGEGGRRHHHLSHADGLPGRRKNGGTLSSSRSAAGGSVGGRSSRQASDPPGPRHRPNPPDREGLARPRQQPYQNTYEQEMYNDRIINNSTSPYDDYDDRELNRMRQQHYAKLSASEYNSQRMQQERQYAKLQHQGRYRDAYENYEHLAEQQIQQRMEQLTQEQYQLRQKKLLQQQQQQQQQQQRTYQPHEIAAALENDDLLPVHAGFVIPSIRGDPQSPSQQEYEQQQMQKNYQQFQEQRRMQQLIQQQEQHQQRKGQTQGQGQRRGQYYHGQEDDVDDDDFIPHHSEAFDRFNPISSGASVSTMASFDVQSMDMSSIGNFSFNQSTNTFGGQSSRGDHNTSMMSGLISTGSQMSRGSMARANKQRKSALERKLEKVNREHRRQQAEEMGKRKMVAKQQGGVGGSTITDQDLYQQQGTFQVPTLEEGRMKAGSSGNHHDYSFKSKMHDQSLNSFGFEAIEEDEMTEASYKLSNLGLSEMSMGTMTFNSDVLSIKSRADGGMKSSNGSNSTKDPSVEGTKRSGSEESASTDPKNPITASSLFDQSVSSSVTSQKAANEAIDLANFNESFRSMDMEERGGAPLPDPDGVGAREGLGSSNGNNAMNPPRSRQKTASSTARASSRQQDPTGGRLPTVARANGATAATSGAPEARKESDNPALEDFGVSFNSIASDASSWLNQYNSMENIGSDKNPWDDEESRG